MRSLAPAPSSVTDANGTPLFGSYRGHLPRVSFNAGGKGKLFEFFHRKRWMYVAIASDELYVSVAAVHLGYAVNLFAFAFDRKAERVVIDRTALGPPLGQVLGDTGGEGCLVKLSAPGARVAMHRPRGSSVYDFALDFRDLRVRAELDTKDAPPPIGVVAKIPGGVVNATEKGALLDARGEATIRGRRFALDGALGGYDYTHGILARRTSWRWAFALGRAVSGERVGLNLVQGFVGEPECAVWVERELYPVGVGQFSFDAAAPLSEWQLRTEDERVDLRFLPGGLHMEKKNFGVVSSRFVQPVGTFSGTIRLDGRAPLELDRVLGVTEDQDVLW